VTYHKSWSYVSKWLRLEELGYIENRPGIPPSPSHLAQLIQTMRAEGEGDPGRGLLQPLDRRERGRQDGAKVVPSPSDVGGTPAIKTYFDLVDAFLEGLVRAAPRADLLR
jgi:hypothetical protein